MKQIIDNIKSQIHNKETIAMIILTIAPVFFFDIYYCICSLVFVLLFYDFVLSLHLELSVDVYLLPRSNHQNKVCFKATNNTVIQEKPELIPSSDEDDDNDGDSLAKSVLWENGSNLLTPKKTK